MTADINSPAKLEISNGNVILSSVYDLITKLCEKLLSVQRNTISNKSIRKCRAKAFQVLLSKKIPEQNSVILLEGNEDPYCHLLAWQYILINQYELLDHANKLERCICTLQNSSSLNEKVLSDVLYVLLKLCRLPEQNNIISISSATTLPPEEWISYRRFDSAKFKLSMPMICRESKFNNESFLLKTKQNIKQHNYLRARYLGNNECYKCHVPIIVSCSSLEFTTREDDGYESPSKDECTFDDIWELVSKTEFTDRRTWETLGNPHPQKEPPFLSEAPSSVCSDAYSIHTSNILQLLGEPDCKSAKSEDQKVFIGHIKNLLVGITSDSFRRDGKGEMYLMPGRSTNGITTSAMESYCRDLILCSSCYTALDNLCNFRSAPGDYQCQGFVFKELCDSINRYLGYYRLAVQSISEETCNLLSVQNYVRPLLSQLTVVASVCKVGPFTESSRLPNGVSLLNYLYQKTVELTDKETIMVLYSILYPCVQTYFNRFLQQWIFEGAVNDPYGEFFVVANSSYLRTRGRTYWTRSHTVRVDMVPDFLSDLAQDVLLCGKTVNLLKLCIPNSPLCMYLLGKKPNLLSCCLSSDQVAALERNSTCYYLEAMAECGPKFQVGDLIARNSEQNAIFMNLVTRKRALTLKRLELEKLRQVEEEIDRKRTATAELKRQYDEALQDKKSQLIREVEREMKLNEELLKMQNLRQKLIAEEASNLIEYYEELDAITEQRRRHVQNHVDRLKMMDVVDADAPTVAPSSERVEEQIMHPDVACSDAIVAEESPKEIEEDVKEKEVEALQSVTARSFAEGEGESVKDVEEEESKGVVNANSEGDTKVSEVARNAAENFKIARRNRARVLSDVFGGTAVETERKQELIKRSEDSKLSDLQRNRLKVLSSEYNLDYIHVPPRAAEMTSCQANKKRVMGTSDCFRALDEVNSNKIVNKEAKIPEEITVNNDNNCKDENANLNDVPRLTEENGNELNGEEMQEMLRVVEKNSINRQTANLKLDLSKLNEVSRSTTETNNSAGSIFGKFLKSPNFELEKPVPMSLGSTPCYLDSVNLGSAPTTAATNFTDEGFDFAIVEQRRPTPEPILFNQKRENRILKERTHLSKRVPIKDAAIVSTRAIKTFIQHSVSVPVNTQMELVNNELLKYIFDDLQLLTHLNSLRNYFFLLDGEFGRNITEGLFEKLYDVNFPVDLINYRTLQHLVYSAIDSSIKRQRNSECLSFKINSLPDTFNLEDPDVLECLSLSYKVSWPLNVLLPSDTIGKYDEVFKFLLKLNRASWVLKKILQELKLLSKKCGTRDSFLVLSSQFQKLHQHRHIMTHFVQTLQNYVVGEVLQTSWDAFEKKLATVINIDEIYSLHVSYIKNILFTCLLNERSLPIRRLIMKIFTVVLKFFHYLRGAEWTFDADSCAFEHANFRKLDDIFRNFEELAAYFVKVARKVAKVGYQPHLIQLLDMLNVNDYYTNRTGFSRSQSNNSTLSSSNSSSM